MLEVASGWAPDLLRFRDSRGRSRLCAHGRRRTRWGTISSPPPHDGTIPRGRPSA